MNLVDLTQKFFSKLLSPSIRDGFIVNLSYDSFKLFAISLMAGAKAIAYRFFNKNKDEIKEILETENITLKLSDNTEVNFKNLSEEGKKFLAEFLSKNLDKLEDENKFLKAFEYSVKNYIAGSNIQITGDNNKVITQGDINQSTTNGDNFNNVEIKGDFVKGDKKVI